MERNRFYRWIKTAFWSTSILMLMVLFQNFSYPDLRTSPTRQLVLQTDPELLVVPPKIYETQQLTPKFAPNFKSDYGAVDIRTSAPTRPDSMDTQKHVLRAPANADGGVAGVGGAWLEREMRPLVQPIEERWMKSVNRELDRFFGFDEAGNDSPRNDRRVASKFVPVDGEDWPEPGDGEEGGGQPGKRGPAGFPDMPQIPGFDGMPPMPGMPGEDGGKEGDYSIRSFKPKDVRLTKANEVTVGFQGDVHLSCEISSGRSLVRLSQPLSKTSSLDLSHDSGDGKNALGFRLSW